MMNTSRTIGALALATLLGSMSLPSLAHKPDCEHPPFANGDVKHGKRLHHALEQLDLTETQRAEMTALHESQREAMRSERTELHQLKKDFRMLAEAGASDAELTAKAEEIAARISDHMLVKTRHLQSIKALLTPEQRAQMDALQQAREARRSPHQLQRTEG